MMGALLKVAVHPAFQGIRFPHIQNIPIGAEHAVYTRLIGQAEADFPFHGVHPPGLACSGCFGQPACQFIQRPDTASRFQQFHHFLPNMNRGGNMVRRSPQFCGGMSEVARHCPDAAPGEIRKKPFGNLMSADNREGKDTFRDRGLVERAEKRLLISGIVNDRRTKLRSGFMANLFHRFREP